MSMNGLKPCWSPETGKGGPPAVSESRANRQLREGALEAQQQNLLDPIERENSRTPRRPKASMRPRRGA
jgi:hypothetical protein